MKRFILLLSILITSTAIAQHKPLKHIEISDFPTNKVSVSNKYNYSGTINTYSASSLLRRIDVSHEKGIKYPDTDYNSWLLTIRLYNAEETKLKQMAKTKAGLGDLIVGVDPIVLYIGESKYSISNWYLGTAFLMIDVNKSKTEHISISGFQGIYIKGQCFIQFDDTEQELWRRCASEVYSERKYY